MVLYHGTSIVAWNNIHKNGVDAFINTDTELDFGHGFYGSFPEDIDYAVKHARKVTRDSLGIRKIKENAVIIEYEIDENLFKHTYHFSSANDAFIDFVFNTRYNYMDEHIPYDVITGPMADGYVDNAMQLYRLFTFEVIKQLVKWNYKLPFNKHRQVAIKNQQICDKIVIRKVTNLKGDVIYEQKQEDIPNC